MASPPSPSRTKIVGDGALDVPFRAVLVLLCRGGRPCPPCMTAAPCRAGPMCPAVTGVGIRLSQKRKTDCRVATRREASTLGVLLAMTARRCRADGTAKTPSPTRGSTYRPVGRGPRAPPKNASPAAGHMGSALQVHTPPKKTTRRPGWGAARFPSMCGTDGGGLYSPLLQAGTAWGVILLYAHGNAIDDQSRVPVPVVRIQQQSLHVFRRDGRTILGAVGQRDGVRIAAASV